MCRFIVVLMLGAAAAVNATAAADPAQPHDILSMTASATVEVPYDMMAITLSTTREGLDAAAVQAQLRQAIDAALTDARRAVRPGQLDVRTGQFNLSPRYAAKGTLSGWLGQAELVLEGRDMSAIAQLAGRLSTLTVARVGYALARETRDKAETEATAQAIARFRTRATDYSRQFGYGAYAVREVNVATNEGGGPPQPMLRVKSMSTGVADESLPVEAGKATVNVNVSGSVLMTR